ncbi:MAG: HepT-like ribonuclease domain-containing protein [Candidatus Odinarchaeia archaeon]
MKKDVEPYLRHILEECSFLMEKSKELEYEKFVNDPVLMRAFVRSLEIIGEGVKNLPNKFREKHPEIPWKDIAGTRDKLIHGYFGVNYQIVWKTVRERIPELKTYVEKILEEINII